MNIYKRIAASAAEAVAVSILISLNLRWIAQARRTLRRRAPSRVALAARLGAFFGGNSSN